MSKAFACHEVFSLYSVWIDSFAGEVNQPQKQKTTFALLGFTQTAAG